MKTLFNNIINWLVTNPIIADIIITGLQILVFIIIVNIKYIKTNGIILRMMILKNYVEQNIALFIVLICLDIAAFSVGPWILLFQIPIFLRVGYIWFKK